VAPLAKLIVCDIVLHVIDDGDFYSVTLAFRQTTGNKADAGH
jgi:hypothetical protein